MSNIRRERLLEYKNFSSNEDFLGILAAMAADEDLTLIDPFKISIRSPYLVLKRGGEIIFSTAIMESFNTSLENTQVFLTTRRLWVVSKALSHVAPLARIQYHSIIKSLRDW